MAWKCETCKYFRVFRVKEGKREFLGVTNQKVYVDKAVEVEKVESYTVEAVSFRG